MADTPMLLIKYYNNANPEYYDYSDAETVQSFLAAHPNIGDEAVRRIHIGHYIFRTDSQDKMNFVIQCLELGEAAIAFPMTIAINITYINIYNQQETRQVNISSTLKLTELIDAARNEFGIFTSMRCEFYSNKEACLPDDVYKFDFQETEFFIKEVCKH
ncbi:hypothetical protein IW148_001006 [Coemansia sp. RSA 1199]|nr:hypothetical protein IW148_001006 [Coemansia sp. RSA 1199]